MQTAVLPDSYFAKSERGGGREREKKMNKNPCSYDLYLLHGLMYLLHKLNAESYHLSFLFKALSALWINNINSTPSPIILILTNGRKVVTHTISAIRGA